MHPAILVLTKIKRWSFIATSTRPLSIAKAANDVEDIQGILRWLAGKNLRIDFAGYPEKPKEDLLPGVRQLYDMHATIRPLLESTMEPQDFAQISG